MVNWSINFDLIENKNFRPKKLEKYFILIIIIFTIADLVYSYKKDGIIQPIITMIIPFLWSIFIVSCQAKNPIIRYKIQLKVGCLFIYNHNATAILWQKRINKIK